MSIQPSILCPHCGTKIEIEARAVQAELPLGPIELKNKLDSPGAISQAERPRDTIRFGSNSESDSFSPHPLAERDSNRIVSERIASCEEDLIEAIRTIVGEKDWAEHAPLWRTYFNENRKALYHALEDWKLHDHRRRPVRNRAAFLTDRFKRAKAEIESAASTNFSTRGKMRR
jgi:hypothetical protein